MKFSDPSSVVIATPVKNSLETVKKTINSVLMYKQSGDTYVVFNDNSDDETSDWLKAHSQTMGYILVNAPRGSRLHRPNQYIFLNELLGRAERRHAVIIESDVVIHENTLSRLVAFANIHTHAGLVGCVTVNESGEICYPYERMAATKGDARELRNVSFCCTLISQNLIREMHGFVFDGKRDWHDLFLSKISRRLGFKNYILLRDGVIHYPHSSRPWKCEKYTSPLLYYVKKLLFKRDVI